MSKDFRQGMRRLAERGGWAYITEIDRRMKLPPREGLVARGYFGEKPVCSEPDCDGVVLLGRDAKRNFELDETARCVLCGRQYRVQMEDEDGHDQSMAR